MNRNETPPARIEIQGQGVGEIDRDLIERRAAEIAAADGRAAPGEEDFSAAREDLTSSHRETAPEELAIANKQVPESPGAPDEQHGAHLVEEGLEEADHERRVLAARELARESLDWDEEE